MCLTKQSKQNEKVEESCRPPPESVDSKKPHFSVRLHLVRHGETESNKSNLVMGQSDSVSYHCHSVGRIMNVYEF